MLPILMYIGEVYGHNVLILVSVSSSAALITKGDTIMTEDTHFLKKLAKNLYKTAYSPLYNQYVKIDKVYNIAGEYIVKTTIDDYPVIFRPTELENYYSPPS
jgi:hypothetical protein